MAGSTHRSSLLFASQLTLAPMLRLSQKLNWYFTVMALGAPWLDSFQVFRELYLIHSSPSCGVVNLET